MRSPLPHPGLRVTLSFPDSPSALPGKVISAQFKRWIVEPRILADYPIALGDTIHISGHYDEGVFHITGQIRVAIDGQWTIVLHRAFTSVERRQSERFPINIPIQYGISAPQEWTRTINISRDGCLFAAPLDKSHVGGPLWCVLHWGTQEVQLLSHVIGSYDNQMVAIHFVNSSRTQERIWRHAWRKIRSWQHALDQT